MSIVFAQHNMSMLITSSAHSDCEAADLVPSAIDDKLVAKVYAETRRLLKL